VELRVLAAGDEALLRIHHAGGVGDLEHLHALPEGGHHRQAERTQAEFASRQHGESPCVLNQTLIVRCCAGSCGIQCSTRCWMRRRMAVSTMPITESTMNTEKLPPVSICASICWIRTPSPACAPTNSPTIAPTTANAAAMFSAARMYGSALGNLALRKICHGVAESERNGSMRSGSTALKPAMLVTSTGKKVSRQMIATFEPMPKPSQTTMIGATATFGRLCSAETYGSRIASSLGICETTTPIARPIALPTKKPSRISVTVMALWYQRLSFANGDAARPRQSATAMSLTGG